MWADAQFIVLNFGIDENGCYLGNTGGHSMFNKLNAHWRALLCVGTITHDEYRRVTFRKHYRIIKEFTAPFETSDSVIVKSGLRLRSTLTQLTQCPYQQAVQESDDAIS